IIILFLLFQIIYEQEGVYIHSSCGKANDQDSLISGILRVLEKDAEVIVDWRPLDDALDSSSILYAGKDSSSVVEWTQAPKERTHRGSELQSSYEAEWDMVNTVSFKKKPHTNGGRSGVYTQMIDGKIKKDPYTATMVGFSKVTNYIFDSLRGSDPSTHQRPPSEMADFLSDAIPGLKINQQEELGFEVITRIDLGERPVVHRREPVSLEEWTKSVDSEGRLLNVESMKQKIFRGGLSHSLRKQAWKFLLGYFPWDSTKEERAQLQKQKTDEYFRMKLQWKSISEEQEKRNSRLRDYRSLIEKDVNRTDRTNKFYEGQDNPGLILLHDILMTYCMYDFDLGYIQGMSDLLSPLLYVMENEVDAFWCFASYMDQMHINELSMKIDVEDILCKAEAISLQMTQCKELPQAVCEILGLQNSEVTTPDSDTGEDDNVGTTCPTSAFPSNTFPVLAASEAKDDSSAQTLASPNACRLTPA
ncbi:TBC1 domain family member 15, partial [Microtus ochrogaster]